MLSSEVKEAVAFPEKYGIDAMQLNEIHEKTLLSKIKFKEDSEEKTKATIPQQESEPEKTDDKAKGKRKNILTEERKRKLVDFLNGCVGNTNFPTYEKLAIEFKEKCDVELSRDTVARYLKEFQEKGISLERDPIQFLEKTKNPFK